MLTVRSKAQKVLKVGYDGHHAGKEATVLGTQSSQGPQNAFDA